MLYNFFSKTSGISSTAAAPGPGRWGPGRLASDSDTGFEIPPQANTGNWTGRHGISSLFYSASRNNATENIISHNQQSAAFRFSRNFGFMKRYLANFEPALGKLKPSLGSVKAPTSQLPAADLSLKTLNVLLATLDFQCL